MEGACDFELKVGFVTPKTKRCGLPTIPDSKYCVWHDPESKKQFKGLAEKLEKAIEEEYITSEGFSLREARLRGLLLHRVDLFGVDMTGVDLSRASLRQCDISSANFQNACLRAADLSECTAIGTNFTNACLDQACFVDAEMTGANFHGATYRGTVFDGARLDNTILENLFRGKSSAGIAILQVGPNPFTAKAGILPQSLGGRNAAMTTIASALEDAKRGTPDHVVILGDWAMGKTAMMLWLKNLAQYQDVWSSYVPIPLQKEETTTVSEAIQNLVEGISRGFPIGVASLANFARTVTQFGFTVASMGVTLSRKVESQPMALLHDTLHSLWEDLKDECHCVAILLDDIDQCAKGTEVLSVLKQTLVQLTATTQDRLFFALSAKPTEWEVLTGIGGHTPVGRYFSSPPVALIPLTDEDMAEVIYRTLDGTGVSFPPFIIERVQEFARGHPYDLQIICKLLYDAQMGGEVPEAAWERVELEAKAWVRRVVTKKEQHMS